MPLDLTVDEVKSIIDSFRKQNINPSLMLFFYEKYSLLLKDIPDYYYELFCKHYTMNNPHNLTLEQMIEINVLIAKDYRSFLNFIEPIMNIDNSDKIKTKIVQTIVEIKEVVKLTQFDLMKIQENNNFKNLNILLIDEFFKFMINTFIYEGYIYIALIHIKLELLSLNDLNVLITKLIEKKKFLIGYESELNYQNLYLYIKEITNNYNFYSDLSYIEFLLKNKFIDSFMLADLYNLYGKKNKKTHEFVCKIIKKHQKFKGNDLATILVDHLNN